MAPARDGRGGGADRGAPQCVSPARRLLCARHPHLGLVAALRRHPELRGEAVIVGGAPELRLPVLAASAAAAACGVAPRAAPSPGPAALPAGGLRQRRRGDVQRLRADVATALGGLSPAVETGDEESYCDLSGSHAAYPDEGRWAAAIARTLMEALDGELPRVGVAGTRFVAHIAALASEPRHVRRVPAGAEAAFLAPLPLGLAPRRPRHRRPPGRARSRLPRGRRQPLAGGAAAPVRRRGAGAAPPLPRRGRGRPAARPGAAAGGGEGGARRRCQRPRGAPLRRPPLRHRPR